MKPHGISVSYGIAHFDSSMDNAEDLIQAADEALYTVKDGRPGLDLGEEPGRDENGTGQEAGTGEAIDGPAAD